jgi:hypothetical protein
MWHWRTLAVPVFAAGGGKGGGVFRQRFSDAPGACEERIRRHAAAQPVPEALQIWRQLRGESAFPI